MMKRPAALCAFAAICTCALVEVFVRSIAVHDIAEQQQSEARLSLRTAGQTLIQKSAYLRAAVRPGRNMSRLPTAVGGAAAAAARAAGTSPFLIPLHQELSPVRQKGKVVSHKITYSGTIHMGHPKPQEFRVVYDTGSAHLIVPSTLCNTPTCKKHARYDLRLSQTGEAINLDGKPVSPISRVDEVTIGFGTASVHGRFVREQVCLGPVQLAATEKPGPCVRSSVVVATKLSPSPFDHFGFDGIFGLGLPALALSNNFSVFDILAKSGRLETPHFAFFLAGESKGEQSELAVGGHNADRLLGPLSWVPLARTELGYWQVQLVGVHVGGRALDVCRDGSCYGILDTGTSHLGVPKSQSDPLDEMLTLPAAGNTEDCRLMGGAPDVVFELRGLNLTLGPRDYMRRLPLAMDDGPMRPSVVSPDSSNGTHDQASESEAEPPGADSPAAASSGEEQASPTEARCTPKLLALDWPRPVGPNVFILGAPVMHRYYTVFDWVGLRAGFGLARRSEEMP